MPKKTVSPNTAQQLLHECNQQIGMGAYQWKLFALCGLGWAADSMLLQALAVTQLPIQKEFKLSNPQVGLLTTFMLVGMMVGAIAWGYTSDIIGRRPVFMWTLVIAATANCVSAFSPDFISLGITMGILGFGIGGNLPVDAALFLEFVPQNRQSLLTLMSLFWPVGQLITSVISLMFIPSNSCHAVSECSVSNNRGWRYVQLVLGLLTFLIVIARLVLFKLEESPKYLISRGRYAEAVQVLKRLALVNGKVLKVSEADFLTASKEDLPLPTATGRFKILFSPELATTTILLWSIWMFTMLGSYMFFSFLPKLLASNGGGKPLSVTETYINYMIVSIVSIPGSIAAMYLAGTWLGRRYTMAINTAALACCLFLFAAWNTSTGALISASIAGLVRNIA